MDEYSALIWLRISDKKVKLFCERSTNKVSVKLSFFRRRLLVPLLPFLLLLRARIRFSAASTVLRSLGCEIEFFPI